MFKKKHPSHVCCEMHLHHAYIVSDKLNLLLFCLFMPRNTIDILEIGL